MTWTPTNIIRADWGRLRLLVNNVDVSFFRDVPAQIGDWSSAEPFDDAVMTVRFPQISHAEPIPSWLVDFANVDLRLIRPDNSQLVLFEGMYTVENDRLSQTEAGLEFTVIGALFQADFYRKVPELFRWGNSEDDIMLLLSREFHPDYRPAMRTLPMIVPGWCGVEYNQIGSWQPVLTGYCQELLAVATSSGLPLPGEPIMGITVKPNNQGYWLVGSMGSVLAFGDSKYYGSMVGVNLTKPATGIGVAPDGEGYWFSARDGGVFTFGYTIAFQGSLGATPMTNEIEGMDTMPIGQGYILVRDDGRVYPFGNAPVLGNPFPLTAFDKAVAIKLTAMGAGYTIATQFGYVYTYGDATYQGGVNSSAIRIVDMAVRPQNDGYWLLRDDGYVYAYGAGATGVLPNFTAPINIKASGIEVSPSGSGLYVVDETGKVFVYGDAAHQGDVSTGGGRDSQWTVMKNPGRQPILKVKDTWTQHWTIMLGTPGIEHDLTRDLIMAPNTYYGEGTDPEGCTWRNSKYPGYQPEAVPVFGGVTLGPGSTAADVRKFEQQMYDSGWTDFVVDGKFSQGDSNLTRRFQAERGLSTTGTINAQTWSAAFQVGSNAGDLKSAYIYPLVARSEVVPDLVNPRGDVVGVNPAFDRNIPRVETHDSYGSRVTKYEGEVSAAARLRRDYPANYVGTLRLSSDPQEGSRFEMKAGQNIMVRGHRGEDTMFHIARVQVSWESGIVTLEIDTAARDMLTLAAFRDRYRELTDPSGRPQRTYRNSHTVEDRKVVWDCESGAGIIPRHAINAGLWNVLRIPCGESGNVTSSEFTVETPARFSVGIFDRPVTHAMLAGVGVSPLDDGYWDDETGTEFWNNWGLIQAYGGSGQAGGFYPGKESDGDALTGRMVDDANWTFQAISPPWLWIALWCESPGTNYISGRLRPGVLT